jgi:hypothetical protein
MYHRRYILLTEDKVIKWSTHKPCNCLSQCLWNIWFVCNDISTAWSQIRTIFLITNYQYFNVFKIFILQFKSHLQSYDKDWKCPPYSAIRASTFCLMVLTLCTVCVITFKIQPSMFRSSSSRELRCFYTYILVNNPTTKVWMWEMRWLRWAQSALLTTTFR